MITNVIYHIPGEIYYDKIGQKYLDIHINNTDPGYWDGKLWGIFGEEHIPHMTPSEGGWSVDDVGRITMYKRDPRNADDYSEYLYGSTISHEFGHTLGLGDAYPRANQGKKLVNNSEVSACSEGNWGIDGSIMYYNGEVYSNDIEMVLEAFQTNSWQYFIDLDGIIKSRVIRLPQEFK